jgi:hypothetical protein
MARFPISILDFSVWDVYSRGALTYEARVCGDIHVLAWVLIVSSTSAHGLLRGGVRFCRSFKGSYPGALFGSRRAGTGAVAAATRNKRWPQRGA